MTAKYLSQCVCCPLYVGRYVCKKFAEHISCVNILRYLENYYCRIALAVLMQVNIMFFKHGLIKISMYFYNSEVVGLVVVVVVVAAAAAAVAAAAADAAAAAAASEIL